MTTVAELRTLIRQTITRLEATDAKLAATESEAVGPQTGAEIADFIKNGPVTPDPRFDRAIATPPVVVTAAGAPTGDACRECGNFALVRTGHCETCQACGATTGCS